LFLVAESSGLLVGTVMGAYDGRRGWVYHLAVEPRMQSDGIGRMLMDAVERRMQRLGIAKVNLQIRPDNLHVIEFYRHLGYDDDHLTSMSKWLRPPHV
jgi:ribosomal protein S18 acetylase RimI-like enzyme